jgi:hypothetical protein
LQYADANGDYQLQDAIRWRIDVLVNDRQPRDIATPTGTVPFVIYQRFWHMVHFGRNQSICMKWLETRKTASAWWVKPRVLQVFHAPRTSILLVGHTGTGKSTLFRAITSRYAATTNGSKPTTKAIRAIASGKMEVLLSASIHPDSATIPGQTMMVSSHSQNSSNSDTRVAPCSPACST